MTKEHEVPLAGNTDLSNNEKTLGDKLFFEGVLYDEIKQNTVKVGTHLSFLIHNSMLRSQVLAKKTSVALIQFS